MALFRCGGGGGGSKCYISQGAPASAKITCGFAPKHVYLGDKNAYGGTLPVFVIYDERYRPGGYFQVNNNSGLFWITAFDDTKTIKSIDSDGITLGSSIVGNLSSDTIIVLTE